MLMVRLAPFLAVGLACGGASPVPHAQHPPEARAAELVAAWAQGLGEPAQLATEDVFGQAALLYRGLSTVSPGAGALVGGNALLLLKNLALCSIPLISYWSEAGCNPDPQVFVPGGTIARGLVVAGVATMTDDDAYAMVPIGEVERVFTARSMAAPPTTPTSCAPPTTSSGTTGRAASPGSGSRAPPAAARPRCSPSPHAMSATIPTACCSSHWVRMQRPR